MPLILNDLGNQLSNASSSAAKKIHTPKFFDSKLTGSGKKMGIINENNDPVNIQPGKSMNHELMQQRKRSYANGASNMTFVPMALIPLDMEKYIDPVEIPDVNEMLFIANRRNCDYYAAMSVYSLLLEETETSVGTKKRKLDVAYKLEIYAVANKNTKQAIRHDTWQRLLQNSTGRDNGMHAFCTVDPKSELLNILNTVDPSADPTPIENFISGYSLYEGICEQARLWEKEADVILNKLFVNIAKNKSNTALNYIAKLLRRLEDYAIPLDLYIKIYNSLQSNFSADETVMLSKQNMYMLLSNTLDSMNQNKSKIQGIPVVNPQPQITVGGGNTPSPEQFKAITATEPLVLVQSGAGTGKSSVIHARINYMIACGIKPEDITVLSFTNAAANHISELCPSVHSMTIARMIDTIYRANFKDHILSSMDTIINCLDIYFNNHAIASKLKHKLIDVTKNVPNAFIGLNNFVENNYDQVIDVLNQIGQTSLELEIVICYQKIDTFIEPPEVQSKYLIIDEVQDNSVFEFVYAIKYVEKHLESLYIVGDCSQTLYEFRASNPKALNVLEASGVFAAYQLQINYRSNQEILDFANVLLGKIEANQYAHIQLQANSLSPVTAQSFQDRVWFRYRQVAKLAEFTENMDAIYAVEVKPYVDKRLAAGEKVAFLAYTRREVNRIQSILEHMYPGKSIVSLVSQKGYNSTIFSTFIKHFWSQVSFAPTVSIVNIICRMVVDNLDKLVFSADKMLQSTQRLLASWQAEEQAVIDNWQRMYNTGHMSLDDFMESVRNNMLQYEIRNNAIRQALLSNKNQEQKNAEAVANADLIVSTIHGAKGLEFPNVVVTYRNKNNMEEDEKRMYYVALTRAMNTELVLAYDTTVNPKIQTDYQEIIAKLTGKGNPAGTDPDDDENLDPNNATNTDIAKAQAFLKEQGYKKGTKTTPAAPLPVAAQADNNAEDAE